MKFIIILLITLFITISCTEDNNPIEEKKCEPICDTWKSCNLETEKCELKTDMCDKKEDCKENFSCNENHECISDEARDTHCDDGTTISCKRMEPTCEDGFIAAIKEGCWECVDKTSCEPKVARDEICDDKTDLTCEMLEPTCKSDQVAAIQNHCWVCVNKSTCNDEIRDSHCDDGTHLDCKMMKPTCKEGFIPAVVNNCWKCLSVDSCLPKDDRDTSCDDGTEITCKMAIPVCEDYEILSHQKNCYICVNKLTCSPWGVSNCKKDSECENNEYCNICGSSSTPDSDDCVAVCTTHDCDTETNLTCADERPECKEELAVIKNGCWVCVDSVTCNEIVQRDTHCDDGTDPTTCNRPAPHCESYNILAHKDDCYYCVDATTCEPSECHFANQCNENTWDIRCTGHWSCEEGNCKETCEDTLCGDGACDSDSGETLDSCPADCQITGECNTTTDCLNKAWEGNASGHWTCYAEASLCVEIADTINCGNGICDGGNGGETHASCPADCQ